jgi:DNA repair exonuclease SbcCD ATPase subunit
MRINYLELHNYAGIYNGMELNELVIDFSKCQHKICLIKGDNGSGKSTIMKALNPLPEPSSAFIPGMTAYKCIIYLDEYTGVLYKIEYVHEVNSKGDRATPKGHIYEITPASVIDLNPSGNVSSAKEIIYDKFSLDPCYLSLTQLSSTKRGMADMKPAERKKFVNSILNNVDAYNDMYKVLSKKSIMYKGVIKNIESRLSTIGDVGKLDLRIQNLTSAVKQADELLNDEKDLKSKAEAVILTLDPDGTKNQKYLDTMSEMTKCESDIEMTKKVIDRKYRGQDVCRIDPAHLTTQIELAKQKKSSLNTEIGTLMSKTEIDTIEINQKRQKLKDVNNGESLEYLRELKKNFQARFSEIREELSKLNINTLEIPFTKDALVQCISTLCEVRDRLSSSEFADIEFLVECVSEFGHERDGELSSLSIMKAASKAMEEHKETINAVKQDLKTKEALKSSFEGLLEFRPNGCTFDDCHFIANAIRKKREYDSYRSDEDYESIIRNATAEYNGAKLMYERMERVENGFRELQMLKAKVNGISSTLKLITPKEFMPAYNFIVNFNYTSDSKVVKTMEIFNQYVDFLYNHLYVANSFEEYKDIQDNLSKIQSDIDRLESNEQLINMLTEDINKLQNELDITLKKTQDNRYEIAQLDMAITADERKLEEVHAYIEEMNKLSLLNDKAKEIAAEVTTLESSLSKLLEAKKTIYECEGSINEIEEKLIPMKKELADLETSRRLYGSYIDDLKANKEMLDKIEVIKYYTSPTTGIQLVFATLYLSKILEKANWMLSGLFGGAFNILPFVITEDEFRIPIAVQGGLNHDDITSMSSAQVALISMIISISMLSQVSTKMNIIVGDEIDASLDTENRRRFFDILLGLMDMVNASQSVLISHNSEYTQNECDIIWLRNKEHITEAGNVIWSFE